MGTSGGGAGGGGVVAAVLLMVGVVASSRCSWPRWPVVLTYNSFDVLTKRNAAAASTSL